jgi:cyclin H
MADYDIAKRLLENSFQIAAGNVPSGKRRQLDELQEKILATIEACRELLETEPPERQQEWWETVRLLRFSSSSPSYRPRFLPLLLYSPHPRPPTRP